MKSIKIVRKIAGGLVLGASLFLVPVNSFAAVEFDVVAIEDRISDLVASYGVDPVVAAKAAISEAVRAALAANPGYPGGAEALQQDIMDALAAMELEGLDITDILLAGNHGLGNEIDPEIEAYEAAGTNARNHALTRGLLAYGPGEPVRPASGI